MENNREFWQFSDQLRLQTTGLSNLSIGDSIWSKKNLDISAPPAATSSDGWNQLHTSNKLAFGGYGSNTAARNNNNMNNTNDAGKIGGFNSQSMNKNFNLGFDKAVAKPMMNNMNKSSFGFVNNRKNNNDGGNFNGKKKVNSNNNNSNNDKKDNNNNNLVDKRFKTLPASEALPRNEAVGGYIFVCNNDTMQENLKRELFGLPPRYRDSVRAITPGLPLFLYNYSTHQLHGIFEAASFGGTNIDPSAWEDKKSHGESRFPAQVKVITRKICEPLEEDSFRPILHHYDGPKFRLELSVPEALALLDIFAETDA